MFYTKRKEEEERKRKNFPRVYLNITKNKMGPI